MKKLSFTNATFIVCCILLCVVSCKKPIKIILTHNCDTTGMNKRIIYTNDKAYKFIVCDLCGSVLEINNGKLIEHNEQKHTPINLWMK